MKEFKLKNKIKAVYKQNKDTPRVGVCLNFAINDAEKNSWRILSYVKTTYARDKKLHV